MIINNFYSPLSDDILKAHEQVWEFKLPEEYRKFLLQYNGGKPQYCHFEFKGQDDGSVLQNFLGITSTKYLNLLTELRDYNGRIPHNFFPIAYDVFGNLILISVKNPDRGKIYFWDHELEADTDHGEAPNYSNLTLIADSFDEFINNLHGDDEVETQL